MFYCTIYLERMVVKYNFYFISELLQSIEKNFLTQEDKRRIKFLLYKNLGYKYFCLLIVYNGLK